MVDPRQLDRSVLATLHYFDLFDFPLTLVELQRFRYGGAVTAMGAPSLSDIQSSIERLKISNSDGFYFLPGREAIVATRHRRHRFAQTRFRRAQKIARWIGLLPTVRLVAVSNSLALSNAEPGSDIDLFVIALPGTLWITRLLAVGALALLGLRPRDGVRDGKICMCFFLSEDAMNLSGLVRSADDPHFRYWITAFVPLYDVGGVMAAFLQANSWIADRLPAALEPRRQRTDGESALRQSLPLMRSLDRTARTYQMRRFPRAIKDRAGHGTDVVISDQVLKFHVNDRRAEYEKKFQERLHAIGESEPSGGMVCEIAEARQGTGEAISQTMPVRTNHSP